MPAALREQQIGTVLLFLGHHYQIEFPTRWSDGQPNFAAGLERVYDPFLFPVLGTKESIKKGKTIFAIQLAVYIYQKYLQCRFIYLFVLYSEISDRFPENGGNRYGSAPAGE